MIRTPFIAVLLAALLMAGCDSGPAETGSEAQAEQEAETRDEANPLKRDLSLEPAELDWVGQMIFQNECAGDYRCLVHWNEGEAFPSLGIGHFIWYPSGVQEPFVESFPSLVQYLIQRQAPVPDWLRTLSPFDAPWPDRDAFLAAENSVRIAELREFLAGTQGLQAEFMFNRARESLKDVIDAAPEADRERVIAHLRALTSSPGGTYALIDYVNFKGEGLSPSERYRGEGWGLLQVLLAMNPEPEQSALDAFRQAAGQVLTRRAENAPTAMERERWLPGWLRRLETYQEPAG